MASSDEKDWPEDEDEYEDSDESEEHEYGYETIPTCPFCETETSQCTHHCGEGDDYIRWEIEDLEKISVLGSKICYTDIDEKELVAMFHDIPYWKNTSPCEFEEESFDDLMEKICPYLAIVGSEWDGGLIGGVYCRAFLSSDASDFLKATKVAVKRLEEYLRDIKNKNQGE